MSIKIKLFAAIKAAAEVLVGVSAGAAASAGVFALITVINWNFAQVGRSHKDSPPCKLV